MSTSFRNAAHRVARNRFLLTTLVVALAAGCSSEIPSAPVDLRVASVEGAGNWGQRGRIVSAELVRTIDKSAAATVIAQNRLGEAFQARFDVQQWSVTYTTVDTDGDLVVAGAGVFLPAGAPGALPMVSFSRITSTVKTGGPSNPANQNLHGVVNAANGSITVVADYLGLGADAAHFHPYLHADVSATTSLDALRAARALLKREDVAHDGRLFIYGYSQGGQVAMALARLIQDEPRSRFRVTAAAPMSGPYDLYGGVQFLMHRDVPYVPNSSALVYILSAFQRTYDLGPLDALLVPPYDAVGRRLIDEGMSVSALQASLPPAPRDVVQPDARVAVMDPDSPLSRALRENDVYDWRPEMPMRLYYATGDLDVRPENASIAETRMHLLGAPDVLAVNLGPLTHGTAQAPAFVAARKWFDTFPAPETPVDPDDAFERADGSASRTGPLAGAGW